MTSSFLVPDPVTVAIECLVFVIVLTGLSRLVLPRLGAAADEQERRTRAADEAVMVAEAKRNRAQREAAGCVVDARREARQIIDRAQARHDQLIHDGRQKGPRGVRVDGRPHRSRSQPASIRLEVRRTQMSVHQYPQCPLIYTYRTELELHLREDHEPREHRPTHATTVADRSAPEPVAH